MQKEGADFRLVLREYLESLVIAVLLAVIIRIFVLSAYKIPTASMLPTLRVGDFIFAYKIPFGAEIPFISKKWSTGRLPKYGDLLVFKHPKDKGMSYVKRAVALPGDKIEIKKGRIILNDKPVEYTSIPSDKYQGLPNVDEYQFFKEKLGQGGTIMTSKKEMEEDFGPLVVPPGEVFMLGDNRFSSDDSRYWGTVPVELIEGEVLIIWMSLDWVSKEAGFPTIRWERVMSRPSSI